ncbi:MULTISPECIES: sigma-70 family RNA polymerase sigma factor [unclassified Oceanobacillus]|uniref:sigma-70 family RNA polymerase sigma factor n=1 Tax=unclassified Oceanobacillus TaxID=2630292 RepID=UPI001E2C3F34|nr:sigma-70 family RNA polymerase sigma factor [Oceanobacillus sp. AG]
MMEKQKFTFEEIFEQNERRIHYHLHKLNIRDPHHEFFQEGLIGMWKAYEKYQPNKGPLGTYFNFMIRNRLIDSIRKESRRIEKEVLASKDEEGAFDTEIFHKANNATLEGSSLDEHLKHNSDLWKHIRDLLTEKQWKWLKYYVIEDLTIKEIAKQEEASIEAVKGWAKEARRKLRKDTGLKKFILNDLET